MKIGNQGVGKTTVAYKYAIYFKQLGYKVRIVTKMSLQYFLKGSCKYL